MALLQRVSVLCKRVVEGGLEGRMEFFEVVQTLFETYNESVIDVKEM